MLERLTSFSGSFSSPPLRWERGGTGRRATPGTRSRKKWAKFLFTFSCVAISHVSIFVIRVAAKCPQGRFKVTTAMIRTLF